MRFNKVQKETFARAVVADIPLKDYVTMGMKLIREEAFKQLPKELKNHLDYLQKQYIYGNGANCMRVSVPNNQYKMSDEVKQKVKALHDQHEEQNKLRRSVFLTTLASVEHCKTIKQAKEALPVDLHKFLPDELSGLDNSTALTTTKPLDDIRRLKSLTVT